MTNSGLWDSISYTVALELKISSKALHLVVQKFYALRSVLSKWPHFTKPKPVQTKDSKFSTFIIT